MDPHSTQYQQQQELNHHHLAPQGYDPSQPYQYDHQAFYSYSQYYQQQSYPYYAYNDNTNGNDINNQHQPQQYDPSIYPPGVPVPDPVTGTHDVQNLQNSYNYHYPVAAGSGSVPIPVGSQIPPANTIMQSSSGVTSKRGRRPSQRGGRGVQGGRGGRGRFGMFHGPRHATPLNQGTSQIPQGASQVGEPPYASALTMPVEGQGHSAKAKGPQPAARCELCKVDCNSLEILEQHKNGKKHKKILKVFNESQAMNKVLAGGPNEQASAKSETPLHFEKVEGSDDKQFPQDASSSRTVAEEKETETGEQRVGEADNNESAKNARMRNFEQRGHGLKRKMRGGKGGKLMRSSDGSKRQVEPPKDKLAVPLICELCNVKCESNVVFQSHLAGKKHLTNLKRFQEQQTVIGQAALQALYPALQALYPALQALCQGDMATLVSQLQQQGFLGPQAQPGPSTFSQAQASEIATAAAALSAIPQISAFNQEQQDFKVEGSGTAGASQSASVIEGTTQEVSDTGPHGDAGLIESKTGGSEE